MSLSLFNKVNKIVGIAISLSDGNEKDMMKFIDNQEQCRRQWDKTEKELSKLTELDGPLRGENKSISVQLELARNQLDNALRKRPIYEKRIQFLEQQLHAISALLNDSDFTAIKGVDRNTLLKMATVKDTEVQIAEKNMHPAKLGRKSLIPSDFDDSEEETIHIQLERAASVARQSSKRKFNPQYQDTNKKHSTETIKSNEATVGIISPEKLENSKELPKPFINPKSPVKCDTYDVSALSLDQTMEESILKSTDRSTHNVHNYKPSAPIWQDHPAYKNTVGSPSLYPKLGNIESEMKTPIPFTVSLSKPHNLIQKKEIKPGKCSVCKKGIGFQKLFFRCQDCNIKCHEECKCMISTMCSTDMDKLKLEECVPPSASIKVPQFIIDCLKEIESRGINQQGLYRISGSAKDVRDFKKKIKNNTHLNLSKINDIHTVTSFLKAYLKAMSESLITRQLHPSFLEAGENNDLPRIYKLIDNLPIVYRHTLAYIFIHLRKVARVQDNLMDFKGLARVLGPTIVGHGCLNPTTNRMYEETRLQPILMEVLFGISDDYWNVILGRLSNSVYKNNNGTSVDIDKSGTHVTATDSPLLGHIEGINEAKRLQNLPNPHHIKKNLFEKLGKKKYFDTPVVRF